MASKRAKKRVLDFGKADLEIVPVVFTHSQGLPQRRWQILPGLTLERMNDSWRTYFKWPEHAKTFSGNYAVVMEPSKFEAAARKRLAGVLKFADAPARFTITNTRPVARMVVLAILMQKCTGVRFGGEYSFILSDRSSSKTLKWKGRRYLGGAYGHMPEQTTDIGRAPVQPKPPTSSVTTDIVTLLEPYHRFLEIKANRLAVAIRSAWTGFFTPFMEQAFLSWTVVLEALVSTPDQEISHQISERVARLLGRTERERIDLYRETKRLYGTRSRIVHGAGIPKKRRQKPGDMLLGSVGKLVFRRKWNLAHTLR
jgi:hypothetical protein